MLFRGGKSFSSPSKQGTGWVWGIFMEEESKRWHCCAYTCTGETGKHFLLPWESIWVLLTIISCMVFNTCLLVETNGPLCPLALCVKRYFTTIKARCCQEYAVGELQNKVEKVSWWITGKIKVDLQHQLCTVYVTAGAHSVAVCIILPFLHIALTNFFHILEKAYIK